MSSTRDDLEFAYKLIKRNKPQDALDLLRPIVAMEPENIHAWWLLAYAATEPREVREALIQVLRLDPNYPNAPKAREMLEQLNQEYPPTFDEIERFPELATESGVPHDTLPVQAEEAPPHSEPDEFSPFEEVAPPEPDYASIQTLEVNEPSDEMFDSMLFAETEEELFPEEDPFAGLEDDLLATEDANATDAALASLPFDEDIFAEPAPVDLEPEFADEPVFAEAPAPTRGRGVGLLLMALTVIVIALGAVLVVYYLMTRDGEDAGASDPGALQAVTLDNQQVADAESAVQAQLAGLAPGDQSRALVAESELGNTFFIEICSTPTPDLPDLVARSMALVAVQAPALQDQVAGVGVTVDSCQESRHDMLYRAVAPVEQAIRYSAGESGWDEFQSYWITS